MSASQLSVEIPSTRMSTKGKRSIGPYLLITEVLQTDVREALARRSMNQKELAEEADVDPASISMLLDKKRVGGTSRVIKRVCTVLKIPLPRPATDADGEKLARLNAANPAKYQIVKSILDQFIADETKKT